MHWIIDGRAGCLVLLDASQANAARRFISRPAALVQKGPVARSGERGILGVAISRIREPVANRCKSINRIDHPPLIAKRIEQLCQ